MPPPGAPFLPPSTPLLPHPSSTATPPSPDAARGGVPDILLWEAAPTYPPPSAPPLPPPPPPRLSCPPPRRAPTWPSSCPSSALIPRRWREVVRRQEKRTREKDGIGKEMRVDAGRRGGTWKGATAGVLSVELATRGRRGCGGAPAGTGVSGACLAPSSPCPSPLGEKGGDGELVL